ncbi:hypothetical protein [Prauserella muralis]|nr:hypothetical protein [Prauserella muralis]TWE22881.1 hypothetical protein FHX69_4137 [Prauserella muralis]
MITTIATIVTVLCALASVYYARQSHKARKRAEESARLSQLWRGPRG